MPHFLTYSISSEKLAGWKSEKRGEGVGETYKSLLCEQPDFKGFGTAYQLPCALSGRPTYVNGNRFAYMRMALEFSGRFQALDEWCDLDLGLTKGVARELGHEHPRDKRTGQQQVLLTSFRGMSKDKEGMTVFEPILVVQPSMLNNYNDVVLLEMFRRAWLELKGVKPRYAVDQSKYLPPVLTENLDNLSKHRFPTPGGAHAYSHRDLEDEVLAAILASKTTLSLETFGQHLNDALSVKPGSCLTAIYRLVWTRRLQVDLRLRPIMANPVGDVVLQTRRWAK